MQDPNDLSRLANSQKKENKKLFSRLRSVKPHDLDSRFHQFHEDAFSRIDCLECANCCKTTSPRFTSRDIERIASALKMKEAAFIGRYLQVDEDGDHVFRTAPCPFLGPDNKCAIYEIRPKACREYPHTDRKRMHQILKETYNNIAVCPAVFDIVQQLKKAL